MNAIEYGSQGRAEVPVDVDVETTPDAVVVRITDRALSGAVPDDAETPDIDAKLAGDQKPRGWGLFLIKNMVDSMDVTTDGSTQTVTLTMAREEPSRWMTDDSEPRSTEVPDEVRLRLSGDLNAPRRRDARRRLRAGRGPRARGGSASTSGTSATSTAPASRSSSGCWPRRAATAGRSGRVGLTEHYREIFRITRLSDFMEIVEGDAA